MYRQASPEGCVGLQRTGHGTKEQEDGAGPPPGGAAGIPPRASLSRQPRPEAGLGRDERSFEGGGRKGQEASQTAGDPGPGETVPRAAVVWGLGAGRPSGGSPQLGSRGSPWRGVGGAGQASNTQQSCFVCTGYALRCLAGFGLLVIKSTWIHEHKQLRVRETGWQTPQRAVAFTFWGLDGSPALPPTPYCANTQPCTRLRRFSSWLWLRLLCQEAAWSSGPSEPPPGSRPGGAAPPLEMGPRAAEGRKPQFRADPRGVWLSQVISSRCFWNVPHSFPRHGYHFRCTRVAPALLTYSTDWL